MKKIVYIGNKPLKADNVAQTGLTWVRGEVHEVADDKAADKLLEFKDVWADANTEYKLNEAEKPHEPEAPKPRVDIIPQGGISVSQYWDPITVTVTGEVFHALQNNEMTTVFMKTEDIDAYSAWKNAQSVDADEEKVDKRSKKYRDGLEKKAA